MFRNCKQQKYPPGACQKRRRSKGKNEMPENVKTEGRTIEGSTCHSIWPSVFLLVSIECGWIVLLGILQLSNAGMGIAIWPNNEDANYYMMLEAGGTKGIPALFWIFDSRNPLNPWFWVALLSTVNYSQGYELFAASRVVDLMLGCAVFMLMDILTRRRCRAYSLATGIAVLIWPFARADHVVWAFNLALAMSVFNLYCYCRFLEGNRQNSRWLVSGLLLYYLTITTYTLHLWGILAIPILSVLLQQQEQPIREPWYSRLGSGCIDLIWYGCFLITYMLIWDTTSPFSAPARGWMKLESISQQFPLSISNLVVSSADIANLFDVSKHWSWGFILATSAFFVSVYGSIFYGKCFPKHRDDSQRINNDWPSFSQLTTSLAIIAALSAGIIQIESTTTIWSPGTRTPMVQKVVQPCLMIIGLFMMVRLIPSKQIFSRNCLLATGLTGICLTGSIAALNNNRIKWRITDNHIRTLTEIMESPEINACTCKNLIVMLDKTTGVFLPTFQFRKYMALKIARHVDSVTFITSSSQSKLINYTSVIFDEDSKGIGLRFPRQINGFTMVPYENSMLFRYSPKDGVKAIPELYAEDLKGTDAHPIRKEWPVRFGSKN